METELELNESDVESREEKASEVSHYIIIHRCILEFIHCKLFF